MVEYRILSCKEDWGKGTGNCSVHISGAQMGLSSAFPIDQTSGLALKTIIMFHMDKIKTYRTLTCMAKLQS